MHLALHKSQHCLDNCDLDLWGRAASDMFMFAYQLCGQLWSEEAYPDGLTQAVKFT